MVVAVFPLSKIGLLLLKQLSKPVAQIIKNEAKKHPLVRKYVIIPVGRGYSRVENLTLRQIKGMKPNEIPPLTEEETIDLGSNAIGEIILFGLLTIILLAEYSRQGDKKAIKERTKAEELANLVETVVDLVSQVDRLKSDLKKMRTEVEFASDIIELEDRRHSFIEDDNFLDMVQKFHKAWYFKDDSKKQDDISA